MYNPTGVRRVLGIAAGITVAACGPSPAPPPASPAAHTLSPSSLPPTTRAQLDTARQAAKRLATRLRAARSGYRRLAPRNLPDLNPMVGEHWINEQHLRVTALDPSRPAYAMFYPLPGGEQEQVLVGTAYGMVQPLGADAPEGFAGAHDRWHIHVLCTKLDQLGSTFTSSTAECLDLGGQPAKNQLAMLHVWLDPENPEGPFATDNVALPFVAVGLRPPSVDDLRDPRGAHTLRRLALALSETYGGTPRGGGFVEQRPTAAFTRIASAERARISRQIPVLRRAQHDGDTAAFETAADTAIVAWERIRDAYLEAAPSPVLRQMLETWFTAAVESNAHAGSHR